eukprot:jgi/Mesen1/2146/ME000152S01234
MGLLTGGGDKQTDMCSRAFHTSSSTC